MFNVGANGRQFYAAGSEYNVFAGRDATRLLAKGFLVEETPEEAREPLNVAQRAALAGWLFTWKSKYEIVGQLEGNVSSPCSTSLADAVAEVPEERESADM